MEPACLFVYRLAAAAKSLGEFSAKYFGLTKGVVGRPLEHEQPKAARNHDWGRKITQ